MATIELSPHQLCSHVTRNSRDTIMEKRGQHTHVGVQYPYMLA